eukprot:SAG31_NODE_240_length_19407_cov_29.686140_13_plen_106_part_00
MCTESEAARGPRGRGEQQHDRAANVGRSIAATLHHCEREGGGGADAQNISKYLETPRNISHLGRSKPRPPPPDRAPPRPPPRPSLRPAAASAPPLPVNPLQSTAA